MFKVGKFLILALVVLLIPPLDAYGQQDIVGRVGIGMSGTFNFPVGGLEKRFRTTQTWGMLLSYVRSSRATMELEYHRNRFDPGKLEESTFYWPPGAPDTWKQYRSPLANNYMIVDAYTVNGLYHFVDRASAMPEGLKYPVVASPYFTFGGGFYRYVHEVSGLIFSGQPDLGSGLDDTLLYDPPDDTDVGWGFHLGGGVEVLASDKGAVDLRVPYHTIIGELRQMDAYGVQRAYPLFYFDVGVVMKFYFARL